VPDANEDIIRYGVIYNIVFYNFKCITPVSISLRSLISAGRNIRFLFKKFIQLLLFNKKTIMPDITLAFLGYSTLLGAALIHVISELAFILNSARLFGK
jgi:cation transport ATPase